MAKIQRLKNGQLLITIPKRLAELKGYVKGSCVRFLEHSPNSFILEKCDKGMSVQKNCNGQLTLTIPRRLAELKQWKKGKEVLFEDYNITSFVLREVEE